MLLMPNKKKIVSIVVAGMKDKKGGSEGPSSFVQKLGEDSGFEGKEVSDEPVSDNSYALEAAAKSLQSALKGDNAKGVVSALKNFFSLCEEEEDYAEGEI